MYTTTSEYAQHLFLRILRRAKKKKRQLLHLMNHMTQTGLQHEGYYSDLQNAGLNYLKCAHTYILKRSGDANVHPRVCYNRF